MFLKLDGVVQCKKVSLWEITPKKAAVGAVVLFVKDDANTGTIHDEVSTIMRSHKVRDLTVELRHIGSVVVP